MNQLPQNEITLENGKRKLNYRSTGIGANIFLTLLVIFGIFCLLMAVITIFAAPSTWSIIPIILVFAVYGYVFYKVCQWLKEMTYDPETQHLFISPAQMLSAYKWAHPQLADDKHEPQEISLNTKLSQPQFLESQAIKVKKL